MLVLRGHWRQPWHPLVEHKFFNMHTVRLDLLHLLDHHGVTAIIVANIVVPLIAERNDVLPGANKDTRLDYFNDDVRDYYKESGEANRLPRLKHASFMLNDFPELHGPAVKAANCRSLVPYILSLQQRAVAIYPTLPNKHSLKTIESLDTVYKVFYEAGYFLTDAQKTLVAAQLLRLGQNFQALAVHHSDQGDPRWRQSVKLHYTVAHLARQANLINPRYTQTYGSEGLVGKIVAVYKKSLDGPFRAGIQKKILQKYCAGMYIDFVEPGQL